MALRSHTAPTHEPTPERARSAPVAWDPSGGRGNAAMCEHVGRSSADHGALRTAMGELDARLDPATGWAAARDSLLSHFAAEERGETEVYGEHPRLLAAVDRVVTAAADPAAEAFGRGLHTHAAAEERSAR